MEQRDKPSRDCKWQGVPDDVLVKRKEPRQEEYRQREHEYPLPPAQRTGGEEHDLTEEQAPQGRDGGNQPAQKDNIPVEVGRLD